MRTFPTPILITWLASCSAVWAPWPTFFCFTLSSDQSWFYSGSADGSPIVCWVVIFFSCFFSFFLGTFWLSIRIASNLRSYRYYVVYTQNSVVQTTKATDVTTLCLPHRQWIRAPPRKCSPAYGDPSRSSLTINPCKRTERQGRKKQENIN